MKWLDNISLPLLVVLALFLLVAPISPEPHLIEKYRMAMAGTLTKPLDVFDVVWHLLGIVLVILKIKRGNKSAPTPDDKDDR